MNEESKNPQDFPIYTAHSRKPRKKRRWLVLLISVFAVLYLMLTAIVFSMVIGFTVRGSIHVRHGNGRLEITTGPRGSRHSKGQMRIFEPSQKKHAPRLKTPASDTPQK